jgi:hypothetical protein
MADRCCPYTQLRDKHAAMQRKRKDKSDGRPICRGDTPHRHKVQRQPLFD